MYPCTSSAIQSLHDAGCGFVLSTYRDFLRRSRCSAVDRSWLLALVGPSPPTPQVKSSKLPPAILTRLHWSMGPVRRLKPHAHRPRTFFWTVIWHIDETKLIKYAWTETKCVWAEETLLGPIECCLDRDRERDCLVPASVLGIYAAVRLTCPLPPFLTPTSFHVSSNQALQASRSSQPHEIFDHHALFPDLHRPGRRDR